MIGFGDECSIGVVCVFFFANWYSDGDQDSVLYRQPTRGKGDAPKLQYKKAMIMTNIYMFPGQ
jgi:hypothetical protein